MIPKRLDSITFKDIEALVTNSVSETRTLDFKRTLPRMSREDAREFLADVTSFANTDGGDLVFGVDEEQGVASALPGLGSIDHDQAGLRLEQMLSASVEPRISGVGLQWISGPDDKTFLVVRAPASMAAPHRVTHTGHDKFYGRHSKGKYPMDTHELRQAFTASEGLPARLRAFHEAARTCASGVEFPFEITRAGPYAVLTITPLSALRQSARVAVTPDNAVLPHRIVGGVNYLRTLDGIIASLPLMEDGRVQSWTLLHEAGRLDAAWTVGLRNPPFGNDNDCLLWPDYVEGGLVDQATAAAARFGMAGIEGPWVVFLTLEGVRGYHLVSSNYHRSQPSWLNSARLPELIVDRLDVDSLKPLADRLWLAFGLERPDREFPSR